MIWSRWMMSACVAVAMSTVVPMAWASEPVEQAAVATPIEFQAVIEAEGKTSAELYALARDWFTKTFVSSEAVLEVQDPARGVLDGKAAFAVSGDQPFVDDGITGVVRYSIRVEVKDGRARCTLSRFTHRSTWLKWQVSFGVLTTAEDPGKEVFSMKKWRIENNAQLKDAASRNVEAIFASLRAALTAPARGDDW